MTIQVELKFDKNEFEDFAELVNSLLQSLMAVGRAICPDCCV